MVVILGAVLLVGITVFLILQPVISGNTAPLSSHEEEPSEAQFKKRVSLLQLRDAEYEYAMGKLGEDDYQLLRGEISAEALAAIRAEEAEEGVAGDMVVDSALEAEIATVRSRMAGGSFCSQCGFPNPPKSRYCSECGSPIQLPDAPRSADPD
jgi:hypothetical protein